MPQQQKITPEMQAAYDLICEAQRKLMALMRPLCTPEDYAEVIGYMQDCGSEELDEENPCTYPHIFSSWEIEGD